MSKLIVLLLTIFSAYSNLYSQWVQQSPLPTAQTLYSVKFIDLNNGWAVGDAGTILHTTNGGSVWTIQSSGTLQQLREVTFVDKNNGFIVGHWGTILKTTNGGNDWVSMPGGETNSLYSVKFTDINNGWILEGTEDFPGDKILHTTDGGANWVRQEIQFPYSYPTVIELKKIFFIDSTNGWAVGNEGVVFKTTNGGMIWKGFSVDNSTGFSSETFVDNKNGWVVGSGAIYRTKDGGITWNNQIGNYKSGLWDVTFVDLNSGVAVGSDGTILRTTDGGSNWESLVNPVGVPGNFSDNRIWGVNFIDKNNGWAVGSAGIILRSKDGGKTWSCQMSGTSYTLYGACFTDSLNGWAVGRNGTIIKTTNSGKFWERKPNPFLGYLSDFFDVNFIDNNTGWVVGSRGSILKTSDGGQSWISQKSGTGEFLNGLKCVDVNNSWVVGSNGLILKTTDGGSNWIIQPGGTTSELFKIALIDKENGWIIGRNGTILHTTNGGALWMNQSMDSSYLFCGVTFSNVNNGWIVGTSGEISEGWFTARTGGVIFHTSDGGINWEKQVYPRDTSDTEFYDVFFIDNNNGWVIGTNSILPGKGDEEYILRTTNGGKVWSAKPLLTATGRVIFTDIRNGWVFGSAGIILHTNTGGIIEAAEENKGQLPEHFILSQNYPNPFNPETIINYTIPQSSHLILKVFDVLGKEVATLVDEEKPPGNYKVKFDGSNLPSGIYFYQIKAGDFVQAKKLMLLK